MCQRAMLHPALVAFAAPATPQETSALRVRVRKAPAPAY